MFDDGVTFFGGGGGAFDALGLGFGAAAGGALGFGAGRAPTSFAPHSEQNFASATISA